MLRLTALWSTKKPGILIQPENAGEPVEDPVYHETISVLNSIVKSRSLITVYIGEDKTPYINTIIEVIPEDRVFTLDLLNSPDAHRRLLRDRKLKISVNVNGEKHCFESEMEGVMSDGDTRFYVVAFPRAFDHQQRRSHRRIAVPMERKIAVKLLYPEDTLTLGQLRDLSVGGFAARVAQETQYRFPVGEYIQKCSIHLANQSVIYCATEIRYSADPLHTRKPRLGLRFTDLNRRDQREIERFLAGLDRDTVKKQRLGHRIL